MNKLLFIMTHIGSNSDNFIKCLKNHSEIDLIKTPDNFIYNNFESLRYLSLQNHKNANSVAIYMDELNYNYKFTKQLIKNNYFIFYFGEPKQSINQIKSHGYSEKNSLLYYLFRLNGMYEYILRTNGIVCNWQNKNLDKISNYLKIRIPIKEIIDQDKDKIDCVSYEVEQLAEDFYNKIMYKIRQEFLV